MQRKQKLRNEKTFTGIIIVTKSGTGFVPHKDYEQDILIEHNALNTALNGDEVEVSILPTRRGERKKGRVRKVLERRRTKFVGTLLQKNGGWVLIPDSKRVYAQFLIKNPPKGTHSELKVLAELVEWKSPDTAPVGNVVDILGIAGEHETEMRAIVLEHGFQSTFPSGVESAAKALLSKRDISPSELARREDFRKVPTFTIDPENAKDFDDALSVKKLGNGAFEIGVHIADVTHYVESGSPIDSEAQKRATSVYLVDRTIPMLPEALSNDLCSLNPNEEKRAFSVIFEFDANLKKVKHRFAKTIIRSDKRFTYKEAQNVLEGKENGQLFFGELRILRDIAQILREERVENGAIEFDTDEVEFELDKNGKPVHVRVKERLETMRTIEDLMLLANKHVAEYIGKQTKESARSGAKAFVYRIHDTPDPDKIAELRIFLRALGHDQLETGKRQIRSTDIAKLMRAIKGRPEEAVVQTATLRAMAKAVYSHKNIGHFSLGFRHYTHFTSPIRRYPDMMVHRVLAAHLDGSHIPQSELKSYQRLAISSSEREVEAAVAERESIKYKQAEYMNGHIGEVFKGKVTGVTQSGLFVAENATRAEGFVRAAAIPGEWFTLDEKNYALVGAKTGKTYRIGDDVTIRLADVRLDDKELDWEIVL